MSNRITDATITKYAADNDDAQGRAVDFTLKVDHTVEAMWTDQTWNDGVAVPKMFTRNDRTTHTFSAGTRIQGVTYIGRFSGCHVLDFHRDGIWYSVTRSDACELLADGDAEFEGPNDADDELPEMPGPFGRRR